MSGIEVLFGTLTASHICKYQEDIIPDFLKKSIWSSSAI